MRTLFFFPSDDNIAFKMATTHQKKNKRGKKSRKISKNSCSSHRKPYLVILWFDIKVEMLT